jgi:hypothetical protein
LALFGLALAITSQPLWTRAAPPGQLPGYMTLHGLDAHGPFRFVLTLALLPIAFAWAARALIARFAAGRSWAWATACAACLASLWLALFAPQWPFVVAPVVLFVPVAFATRTMRARFTPHDVVLLPALIVAYLAALDLFAIDGKILVIAAAWLLFVLRLLLRNTRVPAVLFAAAPLACVLEASVIYGRSRVLSVIALAIVFLSPFTLRAISTARLKWFLRCVAYPLFAFALPLACSVWSAEGMLRVNFFELGHNVQPASELHRGVKLYRDVVPLHGLIEDGLLDAATMKLRRPTVGNVLRAHELFSNLSGVAMYAVGTAASGSPAAGILSVLYYRSVALGSTSSLRTAAALFALALMLKAARRRSPRALAFAGAATAVAMLVSLDQGAFALIVLIITSWRMRSARALIGFFGVAIPVALVFAARGILMDAIARTLALLQSSAAYNIGFVTLPRPVLETRYFPDVLLGFLDRTAIFYAVWLLALIFVAAVRPRRRTLPLYLLACFVVACAITYAERHHLYQQFAGVPFLFAGTALLLRTRRALGYLAAALLVITAGVTSQFGVMSMLRTHRGAIDDSVTLLPALPRARGALFTKADAARVAKLNAFFAQNLGPTETFFDFTDRGLLFFLFDRRCPVPINEAACYETAAGQREVIDRLEHDATVRYALVPVSDHDAMIDGVPNTVRAPLVWSYVQQHFAPVYDDGDVAIRKRID